MENPRVGYIYIRTHSSFDVENACKLGKTHNLPERDSQYSTGEIKRGVFYPVFEISIEKISFVERLLQYEFQQQKYHIQYDAGTEFYNKCIICLIEPFLQKMNISYKSMTPEEIDKQVRINRVKKTCKKINISNLIHVIRNNTNTNTWNEREYQTKIMNYCFTELQQYHKIYLELPTGGGKSYIVYNLFEKLQSEFIIIISPRKIVNSQNISSKYLQCLTGPVQTFNYSIDTNIDDFLTNVLSGKKILICCTQSVDKVYEKITSISTIQNITIWFDEAHWAVEDWIGKESKNGWLHNTNTIKYRIFTTASPNKEQVIQHEPIFGKLYSPIKIHELIGLRWLSPMKPFVYSQHTNNVNQLSFMIQDFTEKQRNYGFSFHNKQKNAFHLFYKHWNEYSQGKTHIKPFLLVSDNFTIEKEPKLQDISLDYEYRNIRIFEKTKYSIGYVVAKYSMGYDFNLLDFICISDPKLSVQDIKQCLGRGIRPDQLGAFGLNKEKTLVVSLPVFIDETTMEKTKFTTIIEVLKYLLYDVEIPLEEIEFQNRYSSSIVHCKNSNENEYIGLNDVGSMFLHLLELENKKKSLEITFEKTKQLIACKQIQSKQEYFVLCDKDPRFSKEPEIVYHGKFVGWIDYLSIERKYYDLDTCQKKVIEYYELYPELKKERINILQNIHTLCRIDPFFPPNDLWVDYYNIQNLKLFIPKIKRKHKITIM